MKTKSSLLTWRPFFSLRSCSWRREKKILPKYHVYSPFAVFIEKLEAKLSCYLLAALHISLVNVARLLGGKRLEMNVCKQAKSMLRVDNRVGVVPCGKSRGRKTCCLSCEVHSSNIAAI